MHSVSVQCCQSYVSNIVQNTAVSSRRHGLRSSADNLSCKLTVPLHTRSKLGERAFSVTGPTACNSLPYDIRKIADTNTFKRHLKFYFFNQYFYIYMPGLWFFMLYVMFYGKSVIRYWTVIIVISVHSVLM